MTEMTRPVDGSLHILFVDDSPSHLESLRLLLNQDSACVYHVTHSTSLSAAQTYLGHNRCDVLLLGVEPEFVPTEILNFLPVVLLVDQESRIVRSPITKYNWSYLHKEDILSLHPAHRRLVIQILRQAIINYHCRDQLAIAKAEIFALRENITELKQKFKNGVVLADASASSARNNASEASYLALDQEKELNELKLQFITMASHEFRTPLTTILGSAELLKYCGDRWTIEKRHQFFERIEQNVKRMTQMLDDILTIGHANSGTLKYTPQPLDLVQFCQSILEEIKLTKQSSQVINLIYHKHDFLGMPICLDEKLLRHILYNLLSNALRYSPEDQPVEVKLSRNQSTVTLEVCDRGIGILPEDQKHLFDAFYRGKNTENIHGTGLGLAIVRRAVELHQGEIAILSQPKAGTTFLVRLPATMSDFFEPNFDSMRVY